VAEGDQVPHRLHSAELHVETNGKSEQGTSEFKQRGPHDGFDVGPRNARCFARSRYHFHRHGSIFMLRDLPSGSVPAPVARAARRRYIQGAWTWISWLIVRVRFRGSVRGNHRFSLRFGVGIESVALADRRFAAPHSIQRVCHNARRSGHGKGRIASALVRYSFWRPWRASDQPHVAEHAQVLETEAAQPRLPRSLDGRSVPAMMLNLRRRGRHRVKASKCARSCLTNILPMDVYSGVFCLTAAG